MDSDDVSVVNKHQPPSGRARQSSSYTDASRHGRKRHSSKSSRSRSKRSHSKTTEGERRHTPLRRAKSHELQNQDTLAEVVQVVGTTERVRQKRRKHYSHGAHQDKFNETPITAVLHDLREDIHDDFPDTYEFDQRVYHGGDDHDYNIMKNKDNIFVEHLSGFSSVSRGQILGTHGCPSANSSFSWWSRNATTSLSVAIFAQKMWLPLADFCHGLLAGLSLMQTILVDRLLNSSSEKSRNFIDLYSHFSLTYTTLFYLLISVCLVSVFDRLDLTHGDWPYLVDVLSVRPRVPWLLVPFYVCGLLLSLAAARSDDMIYLSQYQMSLANSSHRISEDDLEDLSSWHVLNSLRCFCVVVGWLVIASSHPPDLLLRRLLSMLSIQGSESKHKASIDKG